MKNLVLIRVPLRISFIGGGSDLPDYIRKSTHGCVISTTINKYIYILIKKHNTEFKEKIKIHLTNHVENINNTKNIKNKIIRETLKELKFNKAVQIIIFNDVKPSSGLGSSSSLIVGLIKGIYEIQNKKISKEKLFKIATKIELDKLKSPIGYQDHAAAVYGGMNYFKFKNNYIQVKKIKLSKKMKNLYNRFYIYWTGRHRSANIILKDVKKNINLNFQFLNKIRNLTDIYFKKKGKSYSYSNLANMINESWKIKQKFSKKVSNNRVLTIINNLIRNGADAAKLNGAGGDGYITLCCSKKNLFKLKKKN
tara:strand:- start:33 stop:959 length:927 start_codon:yes stop_codon:yes gene_type:complete